MNNKFLYLYCVTNPGQDNMLPGAGIDGNSVYCFEFDKFKIWCSETDKTNIECSLENLKTHNRVSLNLMGKYTVIPFKYGTVIKNEIGVYSLAEELYSRFIESINKLDGKYEAGIKVFGKAGTEDKHEYTKSSAVERLTSIQNKPDSTRYLIDRIRAYEEEKIKVQEVDRLKNTLFGGLIPLCEDYKIINGKSSKLLINSAFLIKKSRAGIFEEQFDSIRTNNPDYSFLFSGPWPPYNFVNISIEGG